ncbi:MAG: hypothetical protein AAFW89_10425 [Bacteroidota bacterium]
MFELVQQRIKPLESSKYDDLNIAFVRSADTATDLEALYKNDVIVLQADTLDQAEHIMRSVRSSQERTITLKPVFIDQSYEQLSPLIPFADGTYNPDQKEHLLTKARSILRRLAHIRHKAHELHFERYITLRILGYMYSRDTDLAPSLNRTARMGYAYPFLFHALAKQRDKRVFKVLERMVEEGYTESKLVDHVHECSSCSGGVLNYRECCPSCGSPDLESSDLIHHFACANVGPEEDYRKGDSLVCPKCDKTLRHIGIDYDKPSSMYTCKTCSDHFQSAQVKAKCMDCGTDNELSHLNDQSILKLSITEKGVHHAIHGFNHQQELGKPSTPQSIKLNPQIFELFKHQEQLRSMEMSHTSYLAEVRIDRVLLAMFHEDRQRIILNEIGTTISSYLSGLDAITEHEKGNYRILLCNREKKELDQLIEVIGNNILLLMGDGLSRNEIPLTIEVMNVMEAS